MAGHKKTPTENDQHKRRDASRFKNGGKKANGLDVHIYVEKRRAARTRPEKKFGVSTVAGGTRGECNLA